MKKINVEDAIGMAICHDITEMKDGFNCASRATASCTGLNGTSFFGGKTSNETEGVP